MKILIVLGIVAGGVLFAALLLAVLDDDGR